MFTTHGGKELVLLEKGTHYQQDETETCVSGEEEENGLWMGAPFFKHRLTVHQPHPPVLPEAFANYQPALNMFWEDSLQYVKECEQETSRRWLYPRLFPVGVLWIAACLGISFAFKHQDVARAVLTVVGGFGVVLLLKLWERDMTQRSRHACLQKIRQGPLATFVHTLEPLEQPQTQTQKQPDMVGNQTPAPIILICEDHLSFSEQMLNKAGFYVTLWLSESSASLNKMEQACDILEDAPSGNGHYYYRVCICKNDLWRKIWGDDVAPLKENWPAPPTPLVDEQTWQDFWKAVEKDQTRYVVGCSKPCNGPSCLFS